jgi:hypothetical protein
MRGDFFIQYNLAGLTGAQEKFRWKDIWNARREALCLAWWPIALLLGLVTSVRLSAQVLGGTVLGTIVDASGAVIPHGWAHKLIFSAHQWTVQTLTMPGTRHRSILNPQ